MPQNINQSMENLANNLKRIRRLKNLSQAKLAELCNVSVNFISEIENGKTWVSAQSLDKFSVVLDVEVYQLFVPDDWQEAYPESNLRDDERKMIDVFSSYRKVEQELSDMLLHVRELHHSHILNTKKK